MSPSLGFLKPNMMGVGVITIADHKASIVAIVFGFLGMRLALVSLARFRNPPPEKLSWWYEHLQGMIGSYIAALTALSAVKLRQERLNHRSAPASFEWLHSAAS